MEPKARLVSLAALASVAVACGVDERSVSTVAPAAAPGATTSPGANESLPGASGGGAGMLDGAAQPTPDETLHAGDADAGCEGAGCTAPPAGEVTLSFSFDGAPSGQVTLASGTNSFVCREACSLTVPRGAEITATAQPLPGGTVVRWSDTTCGNEISCALRMDRDISAQVTIELGFNLVFTSRAQYTPDALPRAGAEANQRCADLASAAGLPGQRWVAWLAAEGPTTALEDDIDPIEGFTHTGGWVRPDGVIVARSPAALRLGGVLHGRDLDETGARTTAFAWTGAHASGILFRAGAAALDCDNWTSLATEGRGTCSQGSGLGVSFGGYFATNCNLAQSLVCFGDDSDKVVPIVTPTPNRLAFLATNLFTPGGGIAAADAICQQEACAAGLTGSSNCAQNLGSTRSFKSYLHLLGQPAWQRFDLEGPHWVRPDGLLWLRAADLGKDGLGHLTALHVTLSQSYLAPYSSVWVGDSSPEGNCQDWTSTAAQGRIGVYDKDDGAALGGVTGVACTQTSRIYCLEE